MQDPQYTLEQLLVIIDCLDDLEMNDDVFWNNRNCILNCNDAFAWGCSDAEDLRPEDVPALKQAYADSKAYNGTLLFICRKRGMRPQGAMYAHLDRVDWPLFDMCGPPRESCHGNPVGTDGIEKYVEKQHV